MTARERLALDALEDLVESGWVVAFRRQAKRSVLKRASAQFVAEARRPDGQAPAKPRTISSEAGDVTTATIALGLRARPELKRAPEWNPQRDSGAVAHIIGGCGAEGPRIHVSTSAGLDVDKRGAGEAIAALARIFGEDLIPRELGGAIARTAAEHGVASAVKHVRGSVMLVAELDEDDLGFAAARAARAAGSAPDGG